VPKRGKPRGAGSGRSARRPAAPWRSTAKRGNGTPSKKPEADQNPRRRSSSQPDPAAPENVPSAPLRLGYVPGATPGKWARIWQQRYPDCPLALIPVDPDGVADQLAADLIDLAIARDLTGSKAWGPETHHAIPLYTEQPVVVFPKDHLLAATDADENITAADLADEVVFLADDDVLYPAPNEPPGRQLTAIDADGRPDPSGAAPRPSTASQAVAWVASGAGLTVLPMSLARLHHRKDVTYRPLADGPQSPVALVWRRDRQSPMVDDFIGVVRGRTANSSRR